MFNGGDNFTEVENPPVDNNDAVRTSFTKTCFHGINSLSGVGIISTSYALASGGWLSLIAFFIIAITTFYCSLLIEQCMKLDPHIETYTDIGYKAFGKKGRIIISVFMHVELYLVTTSFLILEGDNLHKLFPNFRFHLLGLEFGGKKMFVILVTLFVLPSVWLDNLRILSYVSASGVFASVVILASVFWVGVFNGIGFKNEGSKIIDMKGIATSVSIYTFCFGAHPIFPTLYNSMSNKSQFSKVMILSFTLCAFLYASMAIIGYLMFGSKVESQITLNLPTEKLSSKVAIYTTLINPAVKYALMVTPIINAIKSWFSSFGCNIRKAGILFGTPLMISNVLVALFFPYFGYLMAFIGASLSVTVSIILPCLCFMKISGHRRLGFKTVVLIVIIIMAIIVMISGTYQSIRDITSHVYV